MDVFTMARYLVGSYLYTDLFLFILHCFLEMPENRHSRLSHTRTLAINFEQHHLHPHHILIVNHLYDIDVLIRINLLMSNVFAYMTWDMSPNIFMLATTFFGILANMNHYFNHIEIHAKRTAIHGIMYTLCQAGRYVGILLTKEHHKQHHTSPLNYNCNVLHGLSSIYEYAYHISGDSFYILAMGYYLLNPITLGFCWYTTLLSYHYFA